MWCSVLEELKALDLHILFFFFIIASNLTMMNHILAPLTTKSRKEIADDVSTGFINSQLRPTWSSGAALSHLGTETQTKLSNLRVK